MLSLANALSDEELERFHKRVSDRLELGDDEALHYAAEPKLDGAAVSLTYEQGQLVRGATRGEILPPRPGRSIAPCGLPRRRIPWRYDRP